MLPLPNVSMLLLLLLPDVTLAFPFVTTTQQQQQQTSRPHHQHNGVVLSQAVNGHDVQQEATLADETRADFEILQRTLDDGKPLIYMDSGATSQKPRQVLDTIQDYYTKYNANVHRGAHTLSREATTAYEAARDKVAQFIQANTRDEIVFTSGATEALNLIVQTYGKRTLTSSSQVVLTVVEHHANLVPWQILQEEIGFTIHYTQLDPRTGTLDLEHFESLLNEHTAMVSFQHVSNVMGFVNPVTKMVQLVQKKCTPSTKIVLDACQSVPHMPVNVQELGVDFLVASGHKMCGPTGIGFLWGKLDLLNSMPPYQGGGEMIDTVSTKGSTWLPSPSRFEAGTPPIAQAVGLGAAIDYLTALTMTRIEDYERDLAEYLYEQLSQVSGVRILGPAIHRTALCAFVHDTIHPSDLSQFLDLQGIAVRAGHHCCQPLHYEALNVSHSIRASLAFYNTRQEIDLFIHHLKETIEFFESVSGGGGGSSSSRSEDGSSTASSSDDFVPFI